MESQNDHSAGVDVAIRETPTCFALAPGVQLAGELAESGFADSQWLLQRDGHFIQVTELLYRVCEHATGQRTAEEIAAGVSDSSDWAITADQVEYLVSTKLIPMGVIAATNEEGAEHSAARRASRADDEGPLRLSMRTAVISPRFIEPITGVLQALYAPILLIPVLLAAAVAHGWLYTHAGGAILVGLRDILYTPSLMLTVLLVLMVAGVFHEFGHAAALRYGGGKVRGMGVGIYLIYPAIYTDTTDSYRLGRWARVRTDLGGFYFYLIFAVALIGAYRVTGHEFLLMAVVLINLDILYQSLPFVRFDGYWALADLTGIPDFFVYMKQFVRSLLPGTPAGAGMPALKPWVRRVFLGYLLMTLPVLGLLLYLFVTRAPAILTMTWDSLIWQGGKFVRVLGAGDWVGVALSLVQMVFLGLLMGGVAYMIYRLGRKVIEGAAGVVRIVRRRVATRS